MGHDGLGLQVVLFSTVHCEFAFSLHSFFGIHGKRTRGVGFGLGLGCWFITFFFYFFWNACMVVYGFAWFDRVGFLWGEKVSSHRERER